MTSKRRTLSWLLGRPLGHVLAVVLVASLLGSVVYAAMLVRPLVRDLAIALVAHWKVGNEIPYPEGEPAYSTSQANLVWDTNTNAPFFVRRAYEIVPFFASEGVSRPGVYPRVVLVLPYPDYSSLVVAGTAGEERVIRLNERHIDDQADALTTLVHELIHTQGGYFLNPPDGVDGLERSYFIESRTSSATLEVLAAMCRYGDPVACRAFWQDIEIFARRSIQAKALRAGIPWAYELWVGIFLRDDDADRKGEKMDRFWAQNRAEQLQIVERYGELPWNEQVIAGICGQRLQTGNLAMIGQTEDGHPLMLVLAMDFDDTRAELGWFLVGTICANR